MARILISYCAGYSNVFFSGFKEALLKEGNDVFIVNWAGRYKCDISHEMVEIGSENISQQIISFNPDLVFCFNGACPNKLLDELKCRILVFEADMPYLIGHLYGFDNVKTILSQKDSVYVSMDSGSKKVLDRYLGYCFDDDRFLFVPAATALQRVETDYSRNIFFCGTNWYSEDGFVRLVHNEEEYNKLAVLYKGKDWGSCLSRDFEDFFAGQKRLRFLNQLSDLGLEVYGRGWKCMCLSYDMELAELCHDKMILDEMISEYYNSSKISVNFSHPQAINSFSFRVMDIMASNSCILTEDKKDFHLLFDKYISKEIQDSILYKNRFDMREKAIRLLNDEALRHRCIAECNYAIEQNGRWIHRLKEIERFLEIKLVGVGIPNTEGIEYLFTNEQLNKEVVDGCGRKRFRKFKDKLRYKIWKHLGKKLRKKGIIS